MYVSKEVQARVQAKLVECIAILEKRYNRTIKMPSVTYNGSTRVAGTAHYREWKIQLSAPYLMDPANVDEMINDTTPHELAHLVTFLVYPETQERGPMQFTYNGGMKRGKREVHGPHWQEVMWAMGVNPSRTHSMKLSEESYHKDNVRERVRFDWVCTGCKKTIQLGPKHNKSQELYGEVYHKGCRGSKLVKPGTVIEQKKVGNVTFHRTTAPDTKPVHELHYPAPKPAPAPPLHKLMPTLPTSIPAGGTKMDQCKRIYTQNKSLSRAEIIEKFMLLADCTKAGASTYYQSIKKVYG